MYLSTSPPSAYSAVPVRVPAAGSRAPASVLRLHDGRALGAAGPVLSDAHGWVFRGDRQDGYREHSPGQYGLVPAAVTEFVLTAMFLFIIMGSMMCGIMVRSGWGHELFAAALGEAG